MKFNTYIICFLFYTLMLSCSKGNPFDNNGGSVTSKLQGDWYLKSKTETILFSDTTPDRIQTQIEAILDRQRIFDRNSILTMDVQKDLVLTSAADETKLSSGSYELSDNMITFHFKSGDIINQSIKGIYELTDSALTIFFTKGEIISTIKYETPETIELINQNAKIINFNYTFSPTPFSSSGIIEGDYIGQAIFNAPTLLPINNYKIIVKSLSENNASLTFDKFNYEGVEINLNNITIHTENKGEQINLFVTNKEVLLNNQQKLTLSLKGSISDKKMEIDLMTLKIANMADLLFHFSGK